MGFFGKATTTEVTVKDVLHAHEAIRPSIRQTPLTFSPTLSELLERDIFVKWENKHHTGSFKERGVVYFLNDLDEKDRKKGVCTASAGNHALALSYHASAFEIPCTIVMPIHAPLVKVETSEKYGAKVILHGHDFIEAYTHAEALAKKEGLTFVPGFDHPAIVSGQGTAGLEILEQLEEFDSLVVPIGGGGLAAGIALAVKERKHDCFLLGVQSDWVTKRPTSAESHGLMQTSIADGIAVKRIGAVPKPLLDRYIDERVSLSENELAAAIVKYLECERVVIEGAGAAALAAVLAGHLPKKYKRTVLLACGSNIDINVLSRLIDRNLCEKGRLFRVRVAVPDRPGSLSEITRILSESRANVLDIFHDRHYSREPGNVDISVVLEVRDRKHGSKVMGQLADAGLQPVKE